MQRDANILVVDDAAMGRELLAGLLEEDGFTVQTAAGGAEALETASFMVPDLVMLDVMMPGMDGFEVCRRIRQDPALAEVPVIMITALDDRDSRLRGIEAGADDFLTKPYDQAELCARARTITRLNRYRSLLEQRSRFEWVVEQSDDGYVLINGGDRLVYANPKARLLLDLPPQGPLPETGTFMGRARRLYSPRPEEAWKQWPPVQGQVLAERCLVIPESDTSQAVWLEVAWLQPAAAGDDHCLVRLRDVTAHKNTQAGMWTFHSMINHKLRTPLMGIVSGLEFLSQALLDLPSDEAAEMVGISLEAALQLQADITGVLEFQQARGRALEGGGMRWRDLPAMVGRVAENLQAPAPEVVLDPALLGRQAVMAARGLECILLELLDNSRKFHPAGAPRVRIRADLAGDGPARLLVSDDGRTLTPEQLARAWTPYDQMEKYHTGQTRGLGLGLPTVAGLVWEVGGTVAMANNASGPGITVTLTLPLREG